MGAALSADRRRSVTPPESYGGCTALSRHASVRCGCAPDGTTIERRTSILKGDPMSTDKRDDKSTGAGAEAAHDAESVPGDATGQPRDREHVSGYGGKGSEPKTSSD